MPFAGQSLEKSSGCSAEIAAIHLYSVRCRKALESRLYWAVGPCGGICRRIALPCSVGCCKVTPTTQPATLAAADCKLTAEGYLGVNVDVYGTGYLLSTTNAS